MAHLNLVDLLRAAQVLERKVSVALMYSGLRIPQFRLLDVLDGCGQATVTELSRRLNITRASASVLVNELLQAEIVASIEHPQDRRSFHVRLTELGRNKLRVARSDVAVVQSKITRGFPDELVTQLNAFARMLLKQ